MAGNLLRLITPSIRRHRAELFVALVAAALAQGSGIPLPLLTRRLVRAVAHARRAGDAPASDALFWWFGAAFLGLVLLRAGSRWIQTMYGERLGQRVLADIRGQMYDKIQRLGQGYFDRRPSGKILIRFIGDANALKTFIARTVITAPADVLTIIAVAVAVGLIDGPILLAAALPVVVLVPLMATINPHARRWTRTGRSNQTKLCGLLDDRIEAMAAIKTANAQLADRVEVRDAIDRVADANITRARWDAWMTALSMSASTGALAAAGLWGTRRFIQGHIGQGDLLAAIWLILLVRGPINRLTRANVLYQRARVALERIAALIERPPEPGWSVTCHPHVGPGRAIRLRRVGYKDITGNWVIRKLTLSIDGPALVAVTDEVGLAKSVFLELLLRIRRPHGGRIYLDGKRVSRLRIADVRRCMGWVDRQRRVVGAASLAAHHDPQPLFEERLRRAWDVTDAIAPSTDLTLCTDTLAARDARSRDGIHLPADVWLRIATCCALLGDPPILLFDEPTVGLSGDSAKRFADWLEQTARTRLVIVATHDTEILAQSSSIIHLPRLGTPASPKRTREPEADKRDSHVSIVTDTAQTIGGTTTS